jgi:hypothetical protein
MTENESKDGTETSSTEIDGGVKQEEIKPTLSIQVGVENGKVIVLFSQRLTTFTLPPEDAEKMGMAMIHHAEEAKALNET